MRFVFDLDECLVATRQAHELAWQAVGVLPQYEERWIPARMWKQPPTPQQRTEKNNIFPSMLRTHGELLPLVSRVQPGDTVLTGTSLSSLSAILATFPVLQQLKFKTDLGPWNKMSFFHTEEPGVYFDDWPDFVERVNRSTKWTAVLTR